MKILTFILTLCFFSFPVLGQEKIDNLIKKGIEYHDKAEYDKAIEMYEQALALDPDSPLGNYEMALSLVEKGDFISAIQYCNKLVARKDQYAILAYNTKGSSLNYMGRTDEAIEVFEEAILKFGDYYLLFYNLGLAYFAKENYTRAKEAFLNSLELNPDHEGSHLNLGRTMAELGEIPESLLCLYYFLLLEPNTERSAWAYEKNQELLDLYLPNTSMVISSNKTDALIVRTETFFSGLKESYYNKPGYALWRETYIPFFKSLLEAGYTEVFCYYISLTTGKEIYDWLMKNEKKVDAFDAWLEEE